MDNVVILCNYVCIMTTVHNQSICIISPIHSRYFSYMNIAYLSFHAEYIMDAIDILYGDIHLHFLSRNVNVSIWLSYELWRFLSTRNPFILPHIYRRLSYTLQTYISLQAYMYSTVTFVSKYWSHFYLNLLQTFHLTLRLQHKRLTYWDSLSLIL